MTKKTNTIAWVFQILIAVILGMTLPAKFMGAAPPVALFTELGMEPNGRYLTAVLELIACILLLVPTSAVYGAVLAAGLMSGALIGHITKLGFAGEIGQMGFLAIGALVFALIVLFLRRTQLPIVNKMFGGGETR